MRVATWDKWKIWGAASRPFPSAQENETGPGSAGQQAKSQGSEGQNGHIDMAHGSMVFDSAF